MPEHPKKGPAPFSLRLTPEERQALEDRSGREPLGAYIRRRLFEDGMGGTKQDRANRRIGVKDERALARVLALLGGSRLASNLNQLARAANSGALPVTPELEAALCDACAQVRTLRLEVMRALGLAAESGPPAREETGAGHDS